MMSCWIIVIEHVFSNGGDKILDVIMVHGTPKGTVHKQRYSTFMILKFYGEKNNLKILSKKIPYCNSKKKKKLRNYYSRESWFCLLVSS